MPLIGTDLDGTIVGAEKQVSSRTKIALSRCAALGDTIVFLTGRSHRDSMAGLPLEVLSDGRMFCANGAIEFDAWNDRVVRAATIDEAALTNAITVCTERFPGGHWCIDGLDRTVFQEGHPWMPDDGSVVRSFPDVRSALDGTLDPFKVTYLHDAVHPAVMAEVLGAVLAGSVGLTYGSTRNPFFLELTPPGVSKGSALARFARERGFSREQIVAFGDMPNDISMFRVAGTSYAMADADPAVIDAATSSTAGVDQDGVAIVLEARLGARGDRGAPTA